jgi:hypothetical protein
MEIFKNTEYPNKSRDLRGIEEEFSVDVTTCDKDEMLNIGYWNYDMKKWLFHTETLIDPYENNQLVDFVWMYKPKKLKT